MLAHAKVETVKSKETLHRKGAPKKRWWPFGWFVNLLITITNDAIFFYEVLLISRYRILLKTRINIAFVNWLDDNFTSQKFVDWRILICFKLNLLYQMNELLRVPFMLLSILPKSLSFLWLKEHDWFTF